MISVLAAVDHHGKAWAYDTMSEPGSSLLCMMVFVYGASWKHTVAPCTWLFGRQAANAAPSEEG